MYFLCVHIDVNVFLKVYSILYLLFNKHVPTRQVSIEDDLDTQLTLNDEQTVPQTERNSRNITSDETRNQQRKSRRQQQKVDIDHGNPSSKEGSPNQHNYQNEIMVSKPVECQVCSDLSEENVRLEPCDHKPACEDCSSRMKKCLLCGVVVQKRITKDGRVISAKSRQPSAERMRYLESKIAEIEESHACSICMERKKNIVFLCGHGTCAKCADTLKTCHMCRKTITKKISIY